MHKIYNFTDHNKYFFSSTDLRTYAVVESDSDPCVIDDDSPDPVTSWWIKDLGLHESDRQVLQSRNELTDNIINAAQSILARQFPYFEGFQSTSNIHYLNFKEIPSNKKMLQILHTGTDRSV